MNNAWYGALWRIVFILVVSAFIGLIVGRVREALIVGLLILLGLHLYQLLRFTRWLESNASQPLESSDGAWANVYQRIQELRRGSQQRQRQLASLLDQFQRSAEAMPDAAVILGRNHEIRWFNEAASHLLKLRQRQDIGQPILNLLRSPTLQVYIKGGLHDGSVEITAPGDDHIRLAVRIIPYGGDRHLLLAQDVTDRHRLERVRKDFVANVSHELRTPLTVISGFVENLRHDETGCGEKWRRPLSLMHQQTVRMRRIVEDLLLLARLESGQETLPREAVDVASMLADILAEVQAASGEDDAHETALEADHGIRLTGGPQQLRSAFTNLVTNAVKYTPRGGLIRVRWLVDQRGGVVEVRDTGEGVAAEHIPRLTERFYRVDAGRSREQGGTGLGLAIVKHVLQKHGARLEIESELGKGSCFRCIFPVDRLISDSIGSGGRGEVTGASSET